LDRNIDADRASTVRLSSDDIAPLAVAFAKGLPFASPPPK